MHHVRALAAWLFLLTGLVVMPARAAALDDFRENELAGALRQLLEIGLERTTNALGQHNGFLPDDGAHIPLPPEWGEIETDLRAVGLSAASDELIATMNRIAEQAISESRGLLLNTARTFPIDNARAIVTGPADGATLLFRAKTHQELLRRFLPIVTRAARQLRFAEMRSRFFSRARAFGLEDDGNTVLEAYVAGKALESAFERLAHEERLLRENPANSGGKLVNRVFGTLKPPY